MIASGSFKARGTELAYAKSPDKGTPCVTVTVRLEEGPDKGSLIDWVGWLTDRTIARTGESLALFGYDGEDPKTVGLKEVIVVIEHEEYDRTNGEKATRARVAWVNDPNGAGRFQQMTAPEIAGAKDRLKAAMTAAKAKQPPSAVAADEKLFD